MIAADRKVAIAAYKERKTACGVFAIRCSASGQVWVGESRHLDTQQNGLWFSLRLGSGRNRTLQQAWNDHGEAAFSFEPLERLADVTSDYLLRSTLKARGEALRTSLDALKL